MAGASRGRSIRCADLGDQAVADHDGPHPVDATGRVDHPATLDEEKVGHGHALAALVSASAPPARR